MFLRIPNVPSSLPGLLQFVVGDPELNLDSHCYWAGSWWGSDPNITSVGLHQPLNVELFSFPKEIGDRATCCRKTSFFV